MPPNEKKQSVSYLMVLLKALSCYWKGMVWFIQGKSREK